VKMKNESLSNLARRVRKLGLDLSDQDYEYVFGLLLEDALAEAYEEQEPVKTPSRPPSPDSELGKVLAIVAKGTSSVGEIAKAHLGEDNAKNRMHTSSRLSTLAKRGFVSRTDRGEYAAVITPVTAAHTGFDVLTVAEPIVPAIPIP